MRLFLEPHRFASHRSSEPCHKGEQMRQATVVVQHAAGLHARPAAQFVKLAKQFNANINVSSQGKTVNAKSIVLILTLGVQPHMEIEIIAEGAEEQEAVTELVKLVESNFAEQTAS